MKNGGFNGKTQGSMEKSGEIYYNYCRYECFWEQSSNEMDVFFSITMFGRFNIALYMV
jgi:hypothetical protein